MRYRSKIWFAFISINCPPEKKFTTFYYYNCARSVFFFCSECKVLDAPSRKRNWEILSLRTIIVQWAPHSDQFSVNPGLRKICRKFCYEVSVLGLFSRRNVTVLFHWRHQPKTQLPVSRKRLNETNWNFGNQREINRESGMLFVFSIN